MVIFSCPHMGAFWQVCTLRFTRYKDEEAVVLAPASFCNSEYAKKFLANSVFSKIILDKMHVKEYCDSEENLEAAIVQHYTALLASNNILLDNFISCVLFADVENLFSIYLSSQNISHILVEMYHGQFQKDNRYSGNAKLLGYGIIYEALHRKYFALNGEGGFLIHRILFGDENKVIDEENESINFLKSFYELNDDIKRELCDCFNMQLPTTGRYSLFLLNSSGYTLLRTEGCVLPKDEKMRAEYYVVYQNIIDYLNNESVLVKDHPQTHGYNFERSFKHCKIIPNDIPIEFFCLLKENKIEYVYSINSTGGDKLIGLVKEVVKLGDIFLTQRKQIHKLYASFLLGSALKKINTKFYYLCINKQYLDNFNKYMFDPLWGQNELHGVNPSILLGEIIVFIGAESEKFSVELQTALYNASEETKVIFLDKKAIPFAHQKSADEIIKNIVPIRIRKYAIADTVSDLEDEYIYLYCKSASVRMQVKTLYCQRILKNTGIGVSISGKEADNSEHYKILREYSNSCRIDELFRNLVTMQDELKILIHEIGQFKEYLHLKEQGVGECKFKAECIVTEESDKKEGDEEK